MPTPLASDSFDRANANPIGAPWSTSSGNVAMQIVGNVATPTDPTTNDDTSYYSGITWPGDHYSKAKLTVNSTAGGGAGVALIVRQDPAANTRYRLVVDHAASNNVVITKFVTGTPTNLPGWPVTQAWTDGDTWELRVTGSVLQVFLTPASTGIRAQVGASTTDAGVPSGGSPGIGVSTSVTSASINDWEGGSVLSPFVAPATYRAPRVGPYDAKGFLLSPFKQYNYAESIASAAGPITITPDVGALVLTAFEPTIGLPLTILPDIGALVLTGFAPAVGLPLTVSPSFGQLLLAGFAPLIGLPLTLTPGVGAATLTGFAPAIGLPQTVTPGVGALALTGFAPTVGLPVTVSAGVGALVVTGFAPVIDVTASLSVLPGSGALQLDGFAPSIGLPLTVTLDVGALNIVGHEPTIDIQASVPVTTPLTGGHRIPNTYVDIDLRRARARAAKRRLDEERKRLAALKKQEAKIVVQYKSIPLVDRQEVAARSSDRAHLLELEIREYEQRVSLQAARVKEARKANELAKREAEERQSADEAVRASEDLRVQSEWQRIENERLQQEADDDEMMQVLVLLHNDD